MAEGQRMTAGQRAVETMLGSEHVDVIRESVAAMVAELMEAEVVRHEALSDWAGCETSPLGCRSSPKKPGAVRAWNCG